MRLKKGTGGKGQGRWNGFQETSELRYIDRNYSIKLHYK